MITVNFGQCGNQVGHDLTSVLSQDKQCNIRHVDYCDEVTERWFNRKPNVDKVYARAILVDTEQKVVNKIFRQQLNTSDTSWRYERKNAICLKGGGAANNWSFGSRIKGPELKELVLDAFRRETEKCDRVLGIFNIMSSAGGTGSGVGSFMAEQFCDEFPSKCMVNALVLPFRSGEVSSQNYNTVLTLSKLNDAGNITIIFENDQLFKITETCLGIKNIDLSSLNELISLKLASLLQPVSSTVNDVTDIVNHLTPHPAHKIITIKTSPHLIKSNASFEPDIKWNALVNHMDRTLQMSSSDQDQYHDWEVIHMKRLVSRPHKSALSDYSTSVANAVITRGKHTIDCKLSESIQVFNGVNMYPKWLPETGRIYHEHQNVPLLGMTKFIALATNNHSIHQCLNDFTSKAWESYKYKAYLHQYYKYGIEEDDFNEAFCNLENIIKSYKDLK